MHHNIYSRLLLSGCMWEYNQHRGNRCCPGRRRVQEEVREDTVFTVHAFVLLTLTVIIYAYVLSIQNSQ